MLYDLNCLGDWHHVYYYLLCALQYAIAHLRFLFFATLRQYIIRDNVTNMITITTLIDTNIHSMSKI